MESQEKEGRKMSINKKRIYILLIFSASLISVFWMMSINNAFVFDDTTLLSNASLSSYDELFSIYPSSVYLDRPIRDIMIKLLYDMFGSDYVLQHVALVLVHLFNVMLVFCVTKRILLLENELNSDKIFVAACITAVIFGAWPNSIMSVQWVSGNNDLMGTTFALLAFLFYLRSIEETRYKGQNIFFELFFFFLAIRSKEMFYPLPLIFMLCEIYKMVKSKKRTRLSWGCLLAIIMMIVFMAGIFYCKLKDNSITVDINEPYYQSFNPISMLVVLFKYCMIFFDLTNANMNFVFSSYGVVGLCITLLGLLVAVFLTLKRKIGLLFCYIAIGMSIVMVLPMVNQVHRLYLYFPTFFIGLTIAVVGITFFEHLEKIFLAICVGCVLAGNASGPVAFRNYWQYIGNMENSVYTQLKAIKKPVSDSNVYIFMDEMDDYTPFYYGPGSVIKLVYQDSSLKPSLYALDEKIEYKAPYIVLEYIDGHVNEVERDETRTLNISDVYVTKEADGSVNLGIVPEEMKETLQIWIDNEQYTTIVGSDFISASIPVEELDGKENVKVTLHDEYGTISNAWVVDLSK